MGILNVEYDKRFKQINGLNWLPWVGTAYDRQKVLVVGESHYVNNENGDSIVKRDYTRMVIEQYPIFREKAGWTNARGSHKNRTFDMLLFLLTGNYLQSDSDEESRRKLWSNLAYMNLVQRAMEKSKERPNKKDFGEGWKIGSKVIEILDPKICIVFGSSSCHSFEKHFKNKMKKVGKIGRYYPRIYEQKTKYIMILHPSRIGMNCKDQWYKFVHEETNGCLDQITSNR